MPRNPERDLLYTIEYAIVEWLALHRKWGGSETGRYVPAGHIKEFFPGHLKGTVYKAIKDLVRKEYLLQYKGGEAVALNPRKKDEIETDLQKYMERFNRLLGVYPIGKKSKGEQRKSMNASAK